MSRYNKPTYFTKKEIFLQGLTLIVTIVLLVWFLPKNGRGGLRFEVDRPWPYGRLIAPYDFPVFKSEAQLASERDSLHQLYEPFLELSAQEEAQVARFRADFRQRTDVPNIYRPFVEGRLRQVYARGVVSNKDWQLLQQDSVQSVHVYSGTGAFHRPVAQLLTQKTAYEYLLAHADSLGFSRLKLQKLNLNQYLEPNLRYDESKSQDEWERLVKGLSPSSSIVFAGQNIIDRGEIVTAQKYQILKSYEHARKERNKFSTQTNLSIVGQVLYVAVICICLCLYFNLFRRDYVVHVRCVILVLALVLPFPLLTYFLMGHLLLSVYLIPYTMLPIFVRVFLDSRTAFITHVATILLCALCLRYPFEFIITQMVAGMVAIYSLRELSTRSQIIRTAVLVTLASLIVYFAVDLIHGRTLLGDDSLTNIDWRLYKHLFASGVLLIFAYPLMYFLEKIFGFTSNVTLVELSNINNNDLLRQLSEVAPGTFQHSMQVANLAAEVAMKIGAKSQLVRTGALYHDIGKIQDPAFFTENQAGTINPHDKLDNRQSAAIIIKHVTDGLQLAERHSLPRIIRDFIVTHHGRGLVKYFYISYQNAHPEERVDPVPFSYPGPNPSTAEQAILMMADAVEASARSLKEYNEKTIGTLVDRIIDSQVADGFFTDSPITFQDIKTAKEVFKEKLKIIYHTRISYPELKRPNE